MVFRYWGIGAMVLVLVVIFPLHARGQESLKLPARDAGVFDPAEGPIEVEYRLLKEAKEVEVLVEDFRGRIIDRLSFVDLRAGEHKFAWDGLDEDEKSYPEGRYRFNIRVSFEDGTTESARVEARIGTIPKEGVVPAPEVLPPQEYMHKVDGSVSTFWRRNTEDENESQDGGEHRVRVHALYRERTRKAEGVFAMRRPYPKDPELRGEREYYEGCWAMAEQRWKGGKIKGVFRRGLGNLDDPMKLFSDFRSERKKVGSRLEQSYKWWGLNAVCFLAEGDVESEEEGMAGRISFGPPDGWKVGGSYTRREAIRDGEPYPESTEVVAGDLMVPIGKDLSLSMEYARTRDSVDRYDEGYSLGGEYDRNTFRVSGGYIDLGEDFEAEYADPLRGIRTDVRGGEVEMDYLRRESPVFLKNIAVSCRFLAVKRWSNHERIKEGDSSLRFKVGEKTVFHFNWLGREEEAYRTNNLMANVRHRWTQDWSSRVQGNVTRTNRSETTRWLVGTTLHQGEERFRIAFERVRREIEDSPDSPFEENTVLLECEYGPWRLDFSGRRSKRGPDWGTNLFGRLAFEEEFLHRYELMCYVALGRRSAFETESQVELGAELSF